MQKRPYINISNDCNELNYFMHLFLRHLYSIYYDEFILKGSFAQYANIKTIFRPVTDIDISVTDLNEEYELIKEIIKEKDESLTRYKIIHEEMLVTDTLRLFIECKNYMGKTNIQLDLNENPVHLPVSNILTIPNTSLSFEVLSISLEEHIVNKICGSIYDWTINFNKGETFKRCRDLYDVYKLRKIGYDLNKVRELMKCEEHNDFSLIIQMLNSDDFISKTMERYELEKRKKAFENIPFEDIINGVSNELTLILKQ